MTEMLFAGVSLVSNAYFSPCRKWRYFLHRVWAPEEQFLLVIGLNPSTADDLQPDPTVTRCINFAKRWGFGGLIMMNSFAIRGTDPKVLKKVTDPVGPENDYWLRVMTADAQVGRILLAWGNHGLLFNRQEQVLTLIRPHTEPVCFGVTKEAAPRHPLYLKNETKVEFFSRTQSLLREPK